MFPACVTVKDHGTNVDLQKIWPLLTVCVVWAEMLASCKQQTLHKHISTTSAS